MARLLFLCRNSNSYNSAYSYGITGLFNSASFVADALTTHETKVVKVVDGNAIDKEVYEYKPDIVVLEAVWVTPDKLRELVNIPRYRSIKWLIRIHSKPTFLASEGVAIQWLTEYAKIPNVIISGNHVEFNNMMLSIGVSSTLLPNIYSVQMSAGPVFQQKDHIDVGCFGAIRPMKNHILQAAAAMHFADSINGHLKFHVNATRTEQGGENVLKNLRAMFNNTSHELIEHPWRTHTDFLTLVSQMDVGLQVSLSESFNIVSADFVSQNIPIVTSKEVEFIASMYHADTSSILSIARTLGYAYTTRVFYLHKVNQWLLNFHNHKALSDWDRFLR